MAQGHDDLLKNYGYAHQMTLAYGVPYSGKNLPPYLVRAYGACTPPMNTKGVYIECFGKPIDEARNWLAEQAIEVNAKYLFFWDEDVLLPPHLLRELIFLLEHYPKYGVVGGIYCLKTPRPEPMIFRGSGTGPFWDWKVGEVFEVTGIAMGCTVIRTAVFKDCPKPWFKTVSDHEAELDNIHMATEYTEDLWFCKQLTEHTDWKIAAHGGLVCPHVDIATGTHYTLSPDSKPMRAFEMPIGKLKILDIGCGRKPYTTKEGVVVTVDCREDVNPDFRCDFRKLPFGTAEFDVVHSAHALEHVPHAEVGATVDEWVRVLKPEGEIRLNLPDLGWAAAQVVAAKMPAEAMQVIYGQQSYDTDYHRSGFTAATLAALLTDRGFVDVQVKHVGANLLVQARRAKKATRHAVDRHPRRQARAPRQPRR